jgi:hypothetical protein
VPPLPNYERRNALIYQAYVKKDYDHCEVALALFIARLTAP